MKPGSLIVDVAIALTNATLKYDGLMTNKNVAISLNLEYTDVKTLI